MSPIDDNNRNKDLLLEIKNGNIEGVKDLLKAGANANAVDEEDMSALMYAANGGHIEIAKDLLEAGADVNASSAKYDITPLMLAAGEGHTETAKVLLEAGADVNASSARYDIAPLKFAAKNGHTEIVKVLLEAGANVNVVGPDDRMALMEAAENGHTETAKVLLDAGANVNAADIDDQTALIYVARRGHTETAKVLLDAGANVNAADINGETALMCAFKKERTVAKVLLKNGANTENLSSEYKEELLRSSTRDTELANILMDKNVVDQNRDTPLHYAIRNGKLEIMASLIENGASIALRNTDGVTPIGVADPDVGARIDSEYSHYIKASEYCDSLLSDNYPRNDSEAMQNSEEVTEVVKKILKKRLINNDGLEAFTSRFGEDRPYISSILTDEFKAEVRQEVAKNRAAEEMHETLSKGGEYNRNLSDLSEDTQNYIVEEFKKICIKKGVPSYESVNRMIASDKFPDHMRNEITKFVENSKEQFEVIEAAVMYNLNPENSIVPDFLAERTMQYSNSRNERKRSSITTLEAGDLYENLPIESIKELQRLKGFILPEDAKTKLQELNPHLIENVRQYKEDQRKGVLPEPVLLDEDAVLKRGLSVAKRMKKNIKISQDDGSGTPSISHKKGFGQTKGGAHEI